jgi:elongation factor Ts
MDCKKALMDAQVNGDIDKALNWLRMKGISKAAQSGDRAAHDGLIALLQTADKTTLLEVSSETDFVGKNPKFHNFVATVASTINEKLGVGAVNIEDLMKEAPVTIDSNGPKLDSIRDALGDVVSSIRENIVIRRATNFPVGELYAGYVHQRAGADHLPAHIQLGRTIAVVGLNIDPANPDKTEQLLAMGKKLAMHVVR